jgi:hypothetical protein
MDSMATLSEPRPKVKTQVVTCEPFALGEGDVGLLLSTLAGKRGFTKFYRVERLDGPELAYRLTKIAGEVGSDPECDHYNVSLSSSLCDCKGFARWGHCCHLTALRQLFERGVLQ